MSDKSVSTKNAPRSLLPRLDRKSKALVCAVLFFVLSVIAARGRMSGSEVKIFEWIYNLPQSWRWFALLVTQLGNIWMVIGVVGLLFVFNWNPKPALMVARNSFVAYVLVAVSKFVVSRPRPTRLLDEVVSREFTVFGNGFPSGHTALATV